MTDLPTNTRSAKPVSQDVSTAALERLFDAARRLKAEAGNSTGHLPLSGLNIAVLRWAPSELHESVVYRAATDLGAKVVKVRLGELLRPFDSTLEPIARKLGALYDAIDCDDMPTGVEAVVHSHAAVATFSELDSAAHPMRALADLMCICERGGHLGRHPTVAVVGNAVSPRGDAFVGLAHSLGIELRMVDAPEKIGDAAFTAEAREEGHWLLSTAGRAIDPAEPAENFHYVVQAILIDCLVGL